MFVSDFFFFIPFLFSSAYIWTIFFKLNFFNVKSLIKDSVTLTANRSILGSDLFSFFFNVALLNFLFLFVYMFNFRGIVDNFWWSHFRLSNTSFFLFFLVFFFGYLYIYVYSRNQLKSYSIKVDYFFAVVNLILSIPILFFVNTLYTFFFFLELCSCLIFYKFVVSKITYAKNLNNAKKTGGYLSFLENSYMNMLFFNFWATFFSSVFFMYIIIYFFFFFGTTEWFFINYFNSYNLTSGDINIRLYLFSFIILFSFLLKVGFAPLQLYKIEVYRGLNIFSIFFYTNFYLFSYFLIFVNFYLYYLNTFISYWWWFSLIIVIAGAIYLLTLMFDVTILKSFFAYSSIANILFIFCVVLSVYS